MNNVTKRDTMFQFTPYLVLMFGVARDPMEHGVILSLSNNMNSLLISYKLQDYPLAPGRGSLFATPSPTWSR